MAPRANPVHWDYTDAEWEEICAAVKRVRPDPLSDTERKALRLTADDYIAGVRNYPKRKTQANEQRAWKKASGLISDLQQAIKLAAGVRDENRKLSILTEDMLAAVLGKSQPSPGTTKLVLSDVHVMTIGELGFLLSQLKFQIDLQVEICRSRGPYKWETYSGRLEPRVPYMQQILWLWTHRFGGKLTLSVDSTHIPARIYGPLVDYVSAVAGPVMKNDAPKPSALRDVLKRQKKFYAWLADFERERGLKATPFAYAWADAADAWREVFSRGYGELKRLT